VGVLLIFIGSSVQAASENCRLAERYVTLAHAKLAAAEVDEAESLLQQAIDACPSYEAYQSLGELQSKLTQRTDQEGAREAFRHADHYAPTVQAHARTRVSYAQLLSRIGDPTDVTHAYQLILEAQQLDPSNPDIEPLSSQIERQVHNPTQQHILRGGDTPLFKPLESSPVATDAKR
jgi:tetratricopeptide (TPR) repeat protein